jgi:hypothetical protein
MEWLLGLMMATVSSLWQWAVPNGVNVIIGMTLLRVMLPVALLTTSAYLVRRLDARMHPAATA